MKKYKLTDEVMYFSGKTLHRIQALRSFGDVKEGDLGGWIEKEDNLSHEGLCWVFDDAKVFDDAQVFGDAKVFENAQVFGDAWVYGDAWVFGNAEVYGYAKVFDDAKVSGDAKVFGHATVFVHAKILGNAKVYGNAKIFGKAKAFGHAEVFNDTQVFMNACVTRTPISINSSYYTVNIFDDHIRIGCQCQPTSYWEKVNRTALKNIDGVTDEQVDVFMKNKEALLALAKIHQKS